MRYIPLFFYFLLKMLPTWGQSVNGGKLLVEQFIAPSIQGNVGGEDPLRQLTIYLPPEYDRNKHRYPVVYFLHGFNRTDSYFVATYHVKELLDAAIASRTIKPLIVVFPNSYTKFKGSFYTNSAVTGNWADYIAIDVVDHMDKKYRTIANRMSRGICGHSMGGNGALKIAMLNSSRFSAVYALSPARLNTGEHLTSDSPVWKKIKNSQTIEDLTGDFFALEAVDLARTYVPNPNKPPFYCDLPYEPAGDSIQTNKEIVERWENSFPISLIDMHVKDLRKLSAIKFDWGRNDQFPFIPKACKEFSRKLTLNGIKHFTEEYEGDHSNKLGGRDGRIYNDVLSFFNQYLEF